MSIAAKYTQAQAQAVNEVIIDGVSFGYLTDVDAERIISIIRGMQDGKPLQAQAPTKAPTKAKAQPKAEKVFNDCDVSITQVALKGKVAFTIAGNEVGRSGAKAYIKAHGFAWDGSIVGANGKANVFVGTPAQAKEVGLTTKSTKIHVPAEWVKKASEQKAEKKAKKA